MIFRHVRALVLLAVFWVASFAGPGPAHGADAIEVRAASIAPNAAGDGWALSAEFQLPLPLPARQLDAINRGVALHFTIDFELVRPRWYWLDEKIAQSSRTYRLSYHALTRQYRLVLDGRARAFDSLAEALEALSKQEDWTVLASRQVASGVEYEASLRMRLDTSLLPIPLQAGTIANRDWALQAEWKRFRFEP